MSSMPCYLKLYKYYTKITELFPKIFEIYSVNTEKFVFLGDLFYAFVIENHWDIDTFEMTSERLADYLQFYGQIKELNLTDTILEEHDQVFKTHINNLINQYNNYFMNHHLMNANTIDNPSIPINELQLDFLRFRNLKEILISDIAIHSIRNIPVHVKIFHITHCRLKSIDRIPYLLEYINCSYNELTDMPNLYRAHNLQIVNCSHNKLTGFPLNLSDSIVRIYCSHNRITTFPTKLPKRLKILDCKNNRITSLGGRLPPLLSVLSCGYNQIRELPRMMDLQNLNVLLCNNNRIEELPPMPFCLQELNHRENPIQNYFPYPIGVLVV